MSVCLLWYIWYLYIYANARNAVHAAVGHCPVTMSSRIRNSVRASSTFANFVLRFQVILLIISVWHSDVILLTNPSSSEIFARTPLTGLRDNYLLSVIWWYSYLWYSVNKLVVDTLSIAIGINLRFAPQISEHCPYRIPCRLIENLTWFSRTSVAPVFTPSL
jgi:hypothetical protein